MDAFAALSDPRRRRILETLAKRGQMSANQICARFTISQPAVSQHLKVLRATRLVRVEKQAQKRIYSVDPQGLAEVEAWAGDLIQLWKQRFDNLDGYLKKLQEQHSGSKRKKR